MARTNNNKYNYSHILQRDPSSSSPASYSSVARSNGRMLVLTKPSPKPLKPSVTTPPPPLLSPAPKTPDQQAIPDPDPNQISLRPLGHTGPAPSLSFPSRHLESVAAPPPPPSSVFPKPDKFVPPHLRPGFVRKDENPPTLDSPHVKDPSQRFPPHQEHHHHHNQLGRPRSGGYERVRSDPEYLGRPRSSGKRPGTSG